MSETMMNIMTDIMVSGDEGIIPESSENPIGWGQKEYEIEARYVKFVEKYAGAEFVDEFLDMDRSMRVHPSMGISAAIAVAEDGRGVHEPTVKLFIQEKNEEISPFEEGMVLEYDSLNTPLSAIGTVIEDADGLIYMLDEAIEGIACWYAWGDKHSSDPAFPARVIRVDTNR